MFASTQEAGKEAKMASVMAFSNPKAIAEAGERIYRERYQQEYEASHKGEFIAIDVGSGQGFLADSPEGALQNARVAHPEGSFHLIKIGSPGVFRVGYAGRQSGDWLFQ